MRSSGSRLQISGLYVIIDPQQTQGRDPVEVARQALHGGARILQGRDKPPAGFVRGGPTNNAEEARQAERDGADYVAVGSVFPTGSKETTRPASPERLREVKQAVGIPVVAIGGISEENIAQALEAGADAVAVINAVCGAEDVEEAARRLAARFEGGGNRAPRARNPQ